MNAVRRHVRAATALAWVTAAGRTRTPGRAYAASGNCSRASSTPRMLGTKFRQAYIFAVRKIRPVPYIYTSERDRSHPRRGRRAPAAAAEPAARRLYVMMFGLIAATGLRVSEAIDLRLDESVPDGVLHIRETKFYKSRLVPMHPSVVEALGEIPREAKASAGSWTICVPVGRRAGALSRDGEPALPRASSNKQNRAGSRPPAAHPRSSPYLRDPSAGAVRGRARAMLLATSSRSRPIWGTSISADLLVSAGDARADDATSPRPPKRWLRR